MSVCVCVTVVILCHQGYMASEALVCMTPDVVLMIYNSKEMTLLMI